MEPDNIDALKASVTVRVGDKVQQKDVDAQFNHLIELLEARGNDRETAPVYAAYAVFLRRNVKDYQK